MNYHRSILIRCITLLLIGLLSGCASAPIVTTAAELAHADFRTDSTSYTLAAGAVGYGGTISVTYTNHSRKTVYFVNCRGVTNVVLEKLVDGAWKLAWSPIELMCLSPPITVPPNGTWTTRVNISGAYRGRNSLPTFSIDTIPGRYRLEWGQAVHDYHASLPWGKPLPEERRISNEFMLDARPRPAR